jgi:hypothetical protein
LYLTRFDLPHRQRQNFLATGTRKLEQAQPVLSNNIGSILVDARANFESLCDCHSRPMRGQPKPPRTGVLATSKAEEGVLQTGDAFAE